MIKLTYKKQNFIIPNNLNEFKLKDYMDIVKYKDHKRKDLIYNILSVYDIDIKLADRIQSKQILNIVNSIILMINDIDVKLKKEFELDGINYIFDDLDTLRFDQYADLNDASVDEKTTMENLHLIMSILYRPYSLKKQKYNILKFWKKRKMVKVIEEYDSNKVAQRAEIFYENLTMDIVKGAIMFFFYLKLKSINNTLQSSLNEEKKKMNK